MVRLARAYSPSFIAERTVEAHTKQIFHKLGLSQPREQRRRVLAVLAFLRA